MFKNGCPMCGYSADPTVKSSKTPKKKKVKAKELPMEEPLPFWTYALAFLALFIVIALLSYFITR